MSPVAADWLSAASAPGAAPPPCDADCDPDPPPHPETTAAATQTKEMRRVFDMTQSWARRHDGFLTLLGATGGQRRRAGRGLFVSPETCEQRVPARADLLERVAARLVHRARAELRAQLGVADHAQERRR